MIATIPMMVLSFKKFNKKFFNNKLPNNIHFELCKSKNIFGDCRGGEIIRIRINKNIDFTSEEMFENTIIHEMIHAYQWIKYHEMNHKDSFKIEAERIERESNGKYVITRCSSFEEKGYVINEKAVKDKNEKVYVLANQKMHRVFRKASLSELKSLVLYSKELKLKIFEYTGKAFLNEKSGSIYTKSYMLFYNKNNEYEMLCNEANKVFELSK